ncbi:hypothetical protein HDV06_003677 [Boothiomyces sp. JEL0866]|nr:hypothetical protein HDV06_003677 [Boothiomyces sp. JEL0866]
MFQINAPVKFKQKLQNDYEFLTRRCSWLTIGKALPCTTEAILHFGSSPTNNLTIPKSSCPSCPEYVGRLLIKQHVIVVQFNPRLELQQAVIPKKSNYALPVTKDFWLVMNDNVLLFVDHSRPLYRRLLKLKPMDINFAYNPAYRLVGKHNGRQITLDLNSGTVTLDIEWPLSTCNTSILYFRDRTSGVCSYKSGRRVLVEYIDEHTFMVDFNYADHTFDAYVGCMQEAKNYIPEYILAGERLWNYQYSNANSETE